MNCSLIIKPDAAFDIEQAYRWYEEQRASLGRQFVLEVENAFDRISEHPRGHVCVHREIRRALMKRFPYCIFFTIENETVFVLAVMHAKRSPAHWKQRR